MGGSPAARLARLRTVAGFVPPPTAVVALYFSVLFANVSVLFVFACFCRLCKNEVEEVFAPQDCVRNEGAGGFLKVGVAGVTNVVAPDSYVTCAFDVLEGIVNKRWNVIDQALPVLASGAGPMSVEEWEVFAHKRAALMLVCECKIHSAAGLPSEEVYPLSYLCCPGAGDADVRQQSAPDTVARKLLDYTRMLGRNPTRVGVVVEHPVYVDVNVERGV